MVRLFLLLFVCSCFVQAHAQSDLKLFVVDSATAEPLFGASAVLLNTSYSAGADMDGRIILHNVPDGAYTLRVAGVGYRTAEMRVSLPREDKPLSIRLASLVEELEEAVVTTTRTNSRIDDAPQKIEVLGEEELQEEGSLKPGNIASMIGDISSVQIQQTSASSGASVVRMQGLDGRHTLLLRDGVPAFGGLSGGFDLLRIPPLDLQRVELLKGPASTFHGGGAIAGSINFVSKAPTDSLTATMLLNQSTLGETNANMYLSGPMGKVGFTVFGGATVQRARDVDGDGYSDVPEARTYTAHPQVFATPWKSAKLRAGMVWQNDERTGGNTLVLDAPHDTTRYFLHTKGE
ncbi:MAG TPA: TonB-dependent receptor, partial [Flavobacteriales bacterium]|nr:TonB-dependent receptor [Flavobacteriales bacterium]